jgi:hypothetical protein
MHRMAPEASLGHDQGHGTGMAPKWATQQNPPPPVYAGDGDKKILRDATANDQAIEPDSIWAMARVRGTSRPRTLRMK